jgi:tRNA pseudouridine38-40 synthase
MSLYKLKVVYDGTRFNGFQRQMSNEQMRRRAPKRPHWDSDGKRKGVVVAVQECLEDALLGYNSIKTLTLEELALRFAGRTDKGVHARGQVCAAYMTPPEDENNCLEQMKKGINSRLPYDISVERIELCPEPFDPRRDVLRKTYSYTIKYRRMVLSPQDDTDTDTDTCSTAASIHNALGPHSIRSAFDSPCLWVCPWALRDDQLADLCRNLEGNHNYRAFVHKQDRDARTHVLSVDRVGLERKEDDGVVVVRLEFEAKGFRRSMIRNLVGFCVDVCRGHTSVEALGGWDAIWSGGEDVAARINAAPACGLCLETVIY